MREPSEILLDICHGKHYITIKEFYDFCHVPGPCQQHSACEGKTALVKGVIDYGNVFDQQQYPQLPYEKFLIQDAQQHASLEVWATASDNSAIFKKIYQHQRVPGKMVYIQGKVVGFDMPIMGACERGLRLEIDDAASIVFR